MGDSQDKKKSQDKIEKRGFSLPTTSSKPPMPPVKEPKKEDKKS